MVRGMRRIQAKPASEALRSASCSHSAKPAPELPFHFFLVLEQPVVHPFLPPLFPNVFGGIELWAAGGQWIQAPLCGNDQIACPVPTRAVPHHEEELARRAARDLGQQQTHECGLDFGQHERVQHTVRRTHGGLGITILALDPGGHQRTQIGWRPSPAWRDHAPQPRLVFEHQAQRQTVLPLALGFGAPHTAELFWNASCTSRLASGCCGRGTSWRQPCRVSKR